MAINYNKNHIYEHCKILNKLGTSTSTTTTSATLQQGQKGRWAFEAASAELAILNANRESLRAWWRSCSNWRPQFFPQQQQQQSIETEFSNIFFSLTNFPPGSAPRSPNEPKSSPPSLHFTHPFWRLKWRKEQKPPVPLSLPLSDF